MADAALGGLPRSLRRTEPEISGPRLAQLLAELEAPRLDLRHVEDVVDEVQQMLAGYWRYGFDIFALLGGQRSRRPRHSAPRQSR